MRGKDLLEKIELADDKYIAESAEYKKKDKKNVWKILSIAAAIALVLAAIPVTLLIMKNDTATPGDNAEREWHHGVKDGETGIADHTGEAETDDQTEKDVQTEHIDQTETNTTENIETEPPVEIPPEVDMPVFDNPVYTASQISDIASFKTYEASTNQYRTVYAPSVKELDYLCQPVPDSDKTAIYERLYPENVLNKETAYAFINKSVNEVFGRLGSVVPEYTVIDLSSEPALHKNGYEARISTENHFIYVTSDERSEHVSIYTGFGSDERIILDGRTLSVDQSKTDEEIKESLKDTQALLCEIFGACLPDIRIYRQYASDGLGCGSLYVYFCNAEKNKVDLQTAIVSDYILLEFMNTKNHDGAIVSDSLLERVNLTYYHFRSSPDSLLAVKDEVRLISLEEAEALLYNGCVFGGHMCPLCMAAQAKISFYKYDKVGLVYFSGIPFYAFFKDMGTEYGGKKVYAETFVCAVEVSGYEEYFESQKAYHS